MKVNTSSVQLPHVISVYYSSLLPTLKDVQILSKNVFILVIFEYDDICVVQWASATFISPWGSESNVLILLFTD